MNLLTLTLLTVFSQTCIECKSPPGKTENLDTIKKSLEERQKELTAAKNKSKTIPKEITNVVKVKLKSVPLNNANEKPKMISVKQYVLYTISIVF